MAVMLQTAGRVPTTPMKHTTKGDHGSDPEFTEDEGPHSGGAVERNRHVPLSVPPGTAGWAKSKRRALSSMTMARSGVVENPFPNHSISSKSTQVPGTS